MITLPLRKGAANAHYTFNIQLGENFLEFTLNYITLAGPAWSVDIRRDDVLLAAGAMLEPGADILENYEALSRYLHYVLGRLSVQSLSMI